MHIAWKNAKIKKAVLRNAKSNRNVAKRMLDIESAKNLNDLTPNSKGRAHFLEGKLKDLIAIDLDKKNKTKRLICKPLGECLETTSDGMYKKDTITGLMIVDVSDHYKN